MNSDNQKLSVEKRQFDRDCLQGHISSYGRLYSALRWHSNPNGPTSVMIATALLIFPFITTLLVRDPNYLILGLIALGLVGIYVGLVTIIKIKLQADLLTEKKWISQIPFPVAGYPDLLVYPGPATEFWIEFTGAIPDSAKLTALGLKLRIKRREETKLVILMENANTIHQLIEGPLANIHNIYPIKKVSFNYGNREIDYDWWETDPTLSSNTSLNPIEQEKK